MTIPKESSHLIKGAHTPLPADTVTYILSYLSPKEIVQKGVLSKDWKKFSESENVWRYLVPHLPFYKDRFHLGTIITAHEPGLLKEKYKGKIFILAPQKKNETPKDVSDRIVKSVGEFSKRIGICQTGTYTCFSASDPTHTLRIVFSYGATENTTNLEHLQSTKTVSQYLKETDIEELHVVMGTKIEGYRRNETDRVKRAPEAQINEIRRSPCILPFCVRDPKEPCYRIQNSFPMPANSSKDGDIKDKIEVVLEARALELYKEETVLRNHQAFVINSVVGSILLGQFFGKQ